MSTRWPGGIINQTAPTIPHSGMWTLEQVAYLQGQGIWPYGPSDPNFENVTLLLNGNSINGTSTFISDASTNNFQITPSGLPGNSVQNPYQAGYYSNYFNGSSNITFPNSSAWDLTGDYTIECFIYITSTPVSATFIQIGTNSLILYVSASTKQISTAGSLSVTSSTSITLNTWNHIALVRSGSGTNNTKLYINGAAVGQTTDNTSFAGSSSNGFRVGSEYPSDYYINGYISNVRLVNGTAVYTSSFTPPTAPLTAITNTQLLTCQSNRFFDASSNNFTATLGGTPSVTQFQPFTYTTPITNGSGYFDGSSTTRLQTPSNSAVSAWSTDFCIEGWIFLNTFSPVATTLWTNSTSNSDGMTAGYLYPNGTIGIGRVGVNEFTSGAGVVQNNVWTYIAFVRNSSTVTIYVNGVSVASGGTSVLETSTTKPLTLGNGFQSVNTIFTGYISNFRVVKGSSVYTANFTPPTAPLTAVTNTTLLTLQSNVPAQNNTFVDSSANQFLITRNGNTTQGSFSPYGSNWGNYLGNGKYLLATSSSTFASSFTFECWFQLTASNEFDFMTVGDAKLSTGLHYYFYNGTMRCFTNNADAINVGVSLSVGIWYHTALVRSGSTVTLYLNGSSIGTFTNSATFSGNIYVGAQYYNSTVYTYDNGYLSNLRITNTVVYTTTFTPSTTPLTAISGTQLLTCQSNRFIDNSSNAFALTIGGTPSVQRFSPFEPTAPYSTSVIGGSGYFDGSGDFLVAGANANLALGSGNFTFEGWFYQTAYASGGTLYSQIDSYGSSTGLFFSVFSNGSFALTQATSDVITTGASASVLNQWNHFAVVRNSTTVTAYINGVSIGTATISTNLTDQYAVIGRTGASTNSNLFNGYISNVRTVVGTAVYTSSFTPPTAPVTAITNTQFLANFTNAGIPDLAMQNNLETVGDAQVSTSVKKYGTGSLAFDGTGDYLRAPNSPVYQLGSGNLTLEAWVYITSTSGSVQTLMAKGTGLGNQASYVIQLNTSGTWVYNISNNGATWSFSDVSIGTNTLNTWQHIALVRNGSTFTPYLNGVAGTTTTTSLTLFAGTAPFTVGADDAGGNVLYGYVDDLRITNGLARYTANFTPPTAALPTF